MLVEAMATGTASPADYRDHCVRIAIDGVEETDGKGRSRQILTMTHCAS
jgi:hypothetical protein